MSNVYIGSTNTDSTGSATNLNEFNAAKVIAEGDIYYGNEDYQGGKLNALVINGEYGVVATSYVNWNDAGTKEIKIDATDKNILTHNFVDVDINAQDSTNGITVQATHTKRGEIDTGSGSDVIHISTFINDEGWSSHYTVNTNAGNDVLTIDHLQNSKYTSLEIDMGTGNDTIDISALDVLIKAGARQLDLGEGNDTAYGSKGADIIDGGAGVDTILAGAGNDVVTFDANDANVQGQEGFDVLVTQAEDTSIVLGGSTAGFEAVVGNKDFSDVVSVDLASTNGAFVAALGCDAGDQILLQGDWINTEAEAAQLSAEQASSLSASGVDSSGLNCFTFENNGETATIYTDLNIDQIV